MAVSARDGEEEVKAFRRLGRFDEEDPSNRETEEYEGCLLLCDSYDESSIGYRGGGKQNEGKVAETQEKQQEQ